MARPRARRINRLEEQKSPPAVGIERNQELGLRRSTRLKATRAHQESRAGSSPQVVLPPVGAPKRKQPAVERIRAVGVRRSARLTALRALQESRERISPQDIVPGVGARKRKQPVVVEEAEAELRSSPARKRLSTSPELGPRTSPTTGTRSSPSPEVRHPASSTGSSLSNPPESEALSPPTAERLSTPLPAEELFSRVEATLTTPPEAERHPSPAGNKPSAAPDIDPCSSSAGDRRPISPDCAEESLSVVRDAIAATNPIDHWRINQRWPPEFFEADEGTRAHIATDWGREGWTERLRSPIMSARKTAPAVKKSTRAMLAAQRMQSGSSSSAYAPAPPSDWKLRDVKAASYNRPDYAEELAETGGFLVEHEKGIAEESEQSCRMLLEAKQTPPGDSLFRDDIFAMTCLKIANRNEARVIQDIGRLIVPSAENLATFGDSHADGLVESVNAGWNKCIPAYGSRPQPDYSVGFGRSAFTKEQFAKLKTLAGNWTDRVPYMAMWYMYFPILTCEVKSVGQLEIAENQNAHSMTVAVRAVVELFRLVKREKDLGRQVVAFSVAHDDRTAKLHGHYPVLDDGKINVYRHDIKTIAFTASNGKEKWTAYKFTKNVYDH